MNKALDHYSSQNILAKISRNLRILREKFAGLDITPSVDNKTLGLEEFGEEIYYAPSERKDLRRTFTQLKIRSTDRILDYGAGKGAAMLILDEFGFEEVVGVEVSPFLVSIAKKNFLLLESQHLTIYESDARNFHDIDSFTHYYLFHPFPADVLHTVLGNIEDSLQRNPRSIQIIYYMPVHKEVFEAQSWVKLDRVIPGGAFETRVYWANPIN
ncbi:MAG: class I SAM-dependent methyltransferase [Bacteroidota bacterium]